MLSPRIMGIVLLVLGVLGLAYGKFTYTTDRHEATLGPLELSVDEKKTVNVPEWAGVAFIVVGAGVLLVPMKTA